jgi:hypothetical protein
MNFVAACLAGDKVAASLLSLAGPAPTGVFGLQ